MERNLKIFITGGTGLIGSYLVKVCLEKGHFVYVLSRAKDKISGYTRIINLLKFWNTLNINKLIKNLRVIEGDIVEDNLGIKDKVDILDLIDNVEIVYHTAASTNLRGEWNYMQKVNVEGTRHILDLFLKSTKLKKFNHISTCYVVGKGKVREFREDMFDLSQDFYNNYEKSKFEAEKLVREYVKRYDLDVNIFRPSLVGGRSFDGKTVDFKIIYDPLFFFSQEIYDSFPANRDCIQNLINVDTVVDVLYILGFEKGFNVYHITSPNDLTVGEFMELSQQYFNYRMPILIPQERFDFSVWTPTQRIIAEPFYPFFNYKTRHDSSFTREVLRAKYDFCIKEMSREILLNLFKYCEKAGYIRPKK